MRPDLHTPDVSNLLLASKRYFHILENYKEDTEQLYNFWSDVFINFLETTKKTGCYNVLFPNNTIFVAFTEDYYRRILVSLNAAWAIGFEFGETYPQKAHYCLSIQDYDSEFFPQETKEELLLLSKFASVLELILIQKIFDLHAMDMDSYIKLVDQNNKISRDCMLMAFVGGITRYYKINQIGFRK